MTHLLIVDDEPQLLLTLVLSLTHHGFEVSTAADGATALQLAKEVHPDLMLLDLGLPDLDGMQVIQRLHRESPTLPILVLSARSGSHDKIVALDLGAVDYLTKPFDVSELAARIRAIARRTQASQLPSTITFGDVTVDLDARTVTRSRTAVHLTPNEWRMLDILLRHPDRLISSRVILTQLRGEGGRTDPSYLRFYMAQLRRKLEPVPSRPRYLLTDPGLGYRFHPESQQS